MKQIVVIIGVLIIAINVNAQRKKPTSTAKEPLITTPIAAKLEPGDYFKAAKWRNIGPFRGGRSVAASGVVSNPLIYYMGTVGDHGLTPRIADLKVNRKVNEINDLPTPPPRQC